MPELPGGSLPLSAAQAGIWFAQALDGANPIYNTSEYVEIHGPVDPELFRAALRTAVAEADALRIRVVAGGGSAAQEGAGPEGAGPEGAELAGTGLDSADPRQVIEPPWDPELPVVDVAEEPEPMAAALRWMRADLGEPVDLSVGGPDGRLFTAALFRLAADHWVWYQRIHHVAIDGYGFSIVLRRVAEAYTALAAGEE